MFWTLNLGSAATLWKGITIACVATRGCKTTKSVKMVDDLEIFSLQLNKEMSVMENM